MSAPVVVVDPFDPDPAVIERAAALLRRGELVAIPTETVYGLAANALDPAAVRRIYDAKERPSFNPLIVHIAEVSELPLVAREIPGIAHELARRFWPGPLTIVLRRQPNISDLVTAGLDTVGVRIPASEVTRAVIRAAGVPLAAPSANLFTRVSPTLASHVERQLGDRLALILDAGPARVGIESTVVDLTTIPPRILRPGGIVRALIEAVIGPVEVADDPSGELPRPSPGMVERHYAPHTSLILFAARDLPAILAQASDLRSQGQRVEVVLREGVAPNATNVRSMPLEPEGYARALYGMLHDIEHEATDVAFVEEVPREPAWDAIRDRLRRAATAH